ncbi:MAG: hypothetical protein FJ104_00460 [Deltaproteobacteria bacterium]|nr:hypothetical protein [Deltaproteobacteria bacterium]
MASPTAYRSFADFEREEIRPSYRIGFSMDELHGAHEAELDFGIDPFEARLRAAEEEDADD